MPEINTIFIKSLDFSLSFLGGWVLDESRGVFFFGLVAKVLQTGTTSGHFCSYITPKLES